MNQNTDGLEVPPTGGDGQMLLLPNAEETVRAIYRLKNYELRGDVGLTVKLIEYRATNNTKQAISLYSRFDTANQSIRKEISLSGIAITKVLLYWVSSMYPLSY